MKKEFSLKYGDKEYRFSIDATSYDLGDGVTVQTQLTEYTDFDAVEWVLHFENKGEENSEVLSEIWDCNTLLPLTFADAPKIGNRPTEGDACVITMNGMVDGELYSDDDRKSSTEFGLRPEYLDKAPKNTKRFENVCGRSSEGMMPFFDVTACANGYITAVGWTGDWKTEFQKQENGIVMRSGLKETRFYLKPGERVRTSSVLIMKYTNTEDKYNKFRRLIKEKISHRASTASKRDGLLAYELWGGLPSEEMNRRLKELKDHGIKFDDIWIDAGWYGSCTKCDDAFSGDWASHTGEWEINTRVHPGELLDVSESAKAAGARLMLWFEPERAVDGTKIVREHPEWFLSSEKNRAKILNYGNEAARRYVLELLVGYVRKLDLSCYRQDFNTSLTEYFEENDEENRRGITEIKHICGMYRLWDELHEAFPELIIDNCASGGRRIDIETLRRSLPFFRSDYQCNFNENSEVLQAHNSGISKYLPYNGCISKTKNDTYAIRSSYSSSWGAGFYNAVFQDMTEDDFAWAKKITDEYRSIRKYFTMDFYNHGSCDLDPTSWTVWQYHDEETQSGIVMAFRKSESPFERVKVDLKGLTNNGRFIYTNLDDNTVMRASDSIEITLQKKRSSVILKYQPE